MQSTITSLLARPSAPDVRLRAEYGAHKRRLVRLARHRYGLAYEDCEEIADQALFAWYQKLCTPEGVRDDRAFCSTVVRSRAVERLRRRTVPTVELSEAADTPEDVALDELVAEREEIRELHEIARNVLDAREYAILRLIAQGTRRAEIAERFGLSARQVKRILERARARLRRARTISDRQGPCAMVSVTIAEINAGVITAGDRRSTAAADRVARCWRCRSHGSAHANAGRPILL